MESYVAWVTKYSLSIWVLRVWVMSWRIIDCQLSFFRDLIRWHLASVSISAISLCFHLLDSCTVQSKSLTLKALDRKWYTWNEFANEEEIVDAAGIPRTLRNIC
jgi:hypothetical protein